MDEGYAELYEKIVQLELPVSDGKLYMIDCTDTETVFRIVQSIPLSKTKLFDY